jgi:hypothetical protein
MTANRARRKTMRKVALYGTLAIVLATVANVLHTVSHAGQHLIYLPMWQLAYVTAVIYFAPVVTVILLWSRFRQAEARLLLASMAGSFVFSLAYHFVVAGPDNVFALHPGEWRIPFQVSVALLLLVDGIGCLVGIWALNTLSRSPAAVAVPGLRRRPKVESR